MNTDVIPFEYASVERAARFFGCEVNDIFHWNEIGLINIAINFDDFGGTVLSIDEQRYELPPIEGGYIENTDTDYRDQVSSFVCEHIRHDEIANVSRIHGVATGIWIPCPYVIETLRNNKQFCASFWATPYYNKNYRVMVEVKGHARQVLSSIEDELTYYAPQILSRNLILYKDDLIVIRDLLSGKDVTNQKSKAPPVQKVNEHGTQFAVICQLLKIIGLSEDEIYSGSTTTLQRLIEQKAASSGISFPSIDKNTWARWREKFPGK